MTTNLNSTPKKEEQKQDTPQEDQQEEKLDPETILGYRVNKDGLSIQNFKDLNKTNLSPLTGEVMSRQATINIGTIGHVAHGKSTVVKALSTVKTVHL